MTLLTAAIVVLLALSMGQVYLRGSANLAWPEGWRCDMPSKPSAAVCYKEYPAPTSGAD